VAGVGLNDSRWAVGSKGQKTVPTTTIEELSDSIDSFDIILVPGGVVASKYLASRKDVLEIVKKHYDSGKLSTFLCAGPYVAKAAGIHLGKKLTSNPFVEADFNKEYDYQQDRVVIDGNMITR
jgi:putative intracellular protease/amidase